MSIKQKLQNLVSRVKKYFAAPPHFGEGFIEHVQAEQAREARIREVLEHAESQANRPGTTLVKDKNRANVLRQAIAHLGEMEVYLAAKKDTVKCIYVNADGEVCNLEFSTPEAAKTFRESLEDELKLLS